MTSKEFYNSERWRRLRRAVLQRDGWQCQLAKMQGRSEPADVVHHIFPRIEYPEYQWCDWNLISLSYGAHNKMHIRDTDLLTERGELLKQETAARFGIDAEKQVILIIGLPGTGKTTYAKRALKNGVVYDLDAIAAALRLKPIKAESHKAARWLANSLFKGFAEAAGKYSKRILIIRTAPSIEEIIDIDPSEIVICRGGYGNEEIDDKRRSRLAARIQEAESWALANNIKVKEVEDDH